MQYAAPIKHNGLRAMKCEQIAVCARRAERITPHAPQSIRILVDFKIKHAHALLNDINALLAKHEPPVRNFTEPKETA